MQKIDFQLDPALPYLNVAATKGFFYLQYPSGYSYWEIQTEDGQKLKDGNYVFAQEVLAEWTTSDQILIDTILADAPWDIIPMVVPPVEELPANAPVEQLPADAPVAPEEPAPAPEAPAEP